MQAANHHDSPPHNARTIRRIITVAFKDGEALKTALIFREIKRSTINEFDAELSESRDALSPALKLSYPPAGNDEDHLMSTRETGMTWGLEERRALSLFPLAWMMGRHPSHCKSAGTRTTLQRRSMTRLRRSLSTAEQTSKGKTTGQYTGQRNGQCGRRACMRWLESRKRAGR